MVEIFCSVTKIFATANSVTDLLPCVRRLETKYLSFRENLSVFVPIFPTRESFIKVMCDTPSKEIMYARHSLKQIIKVWLEDPFFLTKEISQVSLNFT